MADHIESDDEMDDPLAPDQDAAVEAVAQALFKDNALWITFADNPLAKTLGGPREARYTAARAAVSTASA